MKGCMGVGVCVDALFLFVGYQSKLHENTNTSVQKYASITFLHAAGLRELSGPRVHESTAVMRGGSVREIKQVPFKKKSPAPSYMIYRLWHFLSALSIDIHRCVRLALFEQKPKRCEV